MSEDLGIASIGVARIKPVDPPVMNSYRKWIAEGLNGKMSYLNRYYEIRNNPELLLPGARSIITAAFNYYPRQFQRNDVPQFAYYAYGQDYHDVVRQRLGILSRRIESAYGGDFRICVDTAPLFERYWAIKSGIGIRGLNTQLIIPHKGSYFFLGEILTTVNISPTDSLRGDCGKCGACVKACPANAIRPDGTIDASKCLSYLTIEHRDELPEGTVLGNHVYGCDECQKVCPHNKNARPTDIDEFYPSNEFLALDRETLNSLNQTGFNALFRHSAVRRTKLSGILRNIKHLSDADDFVTLQSNPHR